MTERGLLIVLSGPSGVGKDTVLGRFLETRDDCVLSVSATTRPPRSGEEHGREYYFISPGEFAGLVEGGNMLEWAEYSGNRYGTPAREVDRLRDAGKHVILEIEVQGAMQVREQCPRAVFVFLMPPSREVLRQRLSGRGTESAEVIEKRLAAAEYEISHAAGYDYIIVNHNVEDSCKLLDAVITASTCSVRHNEANITEECADA